MEIEEIFTLFFFSLNEKGLNITDSKVDCFSLERLFFRRQNTLHECMHILTHLYMHTHHSTCENYE